MNIINNDSMRKMISVILAVIFGVLFITVVASAVTTISTTITTAGNITTSAGNIEATAGTLTVGSTALLTGDVTMSGGNGALTLTTTNSATSTAVIGCVQTYATSTATAVRLGIGTQGTTSPLSSGGNSVGYVLWQYGTCPF